MVCGGGGRWQVQEAGIRKSVRLTGTTLFAAVAIWGLLLPPASCFLLLPAFCYWLLASYLPSHRHANRAHITATVEGTQTDGVFARSQVGNVDCVTLIPTISDSVVRKYRGPQ